MPLESVPCRLTPLIVPQVAGLRDGIDAIQSLLRAGTGVTGTPGATQLKRDMTRARGCPPPPADRPPQASQPNLLERFLPFGSSSPAGPSIGGGGSGVDDTTFRRLSRAAVESNLSA